jgi:tetratricopeptide (TPR) repeat protein
MSGPSSSNKIMRSNRFIFAFVFAAAIVAALPFTATAQSKKDRDNARKLVAQAESAVGQKDYRRAADLFGQALALVPNNPPIHYRKGLAHYQLKENDQALNELSIALSQGFAPLQVYKVRAFIYYEQKNYDPAIDDIKKGLALEPRDPQFLKGLGEVYLAKGNFGEAITALKNAEQVLPNDADVHYNLARAYFASGDARSQAAEADAALKGGTRFPGEAYFLLGDANKKLRNVAAAIDAYQKAISAKPDIYQSYRDLSDIYRSENRFADAIKVSKAGVLKFPTDGGGLWTDLSWYYSLADRPDDAVQAAKAAIQYAPQQYAAYTNLCRAYNDTKAYDLAISACNTALRLQPGDGETYFYLGRAYNLTGKTTEATKFYGLAVKGLLDFTSKNPGYSDGWYLLGNAYFADNQRDKAIEAYQRCLSLAPKFAKARFNLGAIYALKKNKPAATEQYNILLKSDANLAAQLKKVIDGN